MSSSSSDPIYVELLDSALTSAGFAATIASYKVSADDIDSAGRQWPFYNLPIYGDALLNGFFVLNNNNGSRDHLDTLFETVDHIIAAAVAEVEVDQNYGSSGTPGSNYALHGYSSPQTSKGASAGYVYSAWANVPQLWAIQFAEALCIISDRILRSGQTTTADKLKARGYIEWLSKEVLERYHTSNINGLYFNMNYEVEQMVCNWNNPVGTPQGWSDKPIMTGTADAYVEKWFKTWGITLPVYLSTLGYFNNYPNSPIADYRSWFADFSGITIGDVGAQYGQTKVHGTTYHVDGYTEFPEQSLYDINHYARHMRFTAAMKSTAQLTDPAAIAEVDTLLTAFEENVERFTIDGSCVEFSQYADGTSDPVIPNGHDRPITGWGVFCLENAVIRGKWEEFVGYLEAGAGDPCYVTGYDAINLANMRSWVSLGEDGTTRDSVYKDWT